MAHARKKLPVYSGAGELRYRGFQGSVDYEVQGEPTSLRLGPLRLRGSFTATAEVAEGAFRAGEGQLTLEGGQAFRIMIVGHSTGSNIAYFEMRV